MAFHLAPSTLALLLTSHFSLLTSHFSLLTSHFSPRLTLVRLLPHLTGKHDQAAIGSGGAGNLHPRRRPRERTGRRFDRRREDRDRVDAAAARVAREDVVSLSDRHRDDVGRDGGKDHRRRAQHTVR